MTRLLTSLACPGGRRGALQVLYFHQVLPAPDLLRPMDPTAEEFDALLALLKRDYRILRLTEGLDRMGRGSLPPAALAITFDDGYADNFSVAAPILREHGLSATFFIATAFLGRGVMFNDLVIEGMRVAKGDTLDLGFLGLGQVSIVSGADRLKAAQAVIGALKYLPADQRLDQARRFAEACGLADDPRLMMQPEDVRNLVESGMEIGAHTHTHPILAGLTPKEAERDISRGRDELASILGSAPRLFAYPNGRLGRDYGPEHVSLVQRLGFDAAFTTNPGICRNSDNRWELARFTPWDRTPRRFALRLMQARLGLL